MDYMVDLDPTRRVLRITVTMALTDEECKNIDLTTKRLASSGGPYAAAILDLSQVTEFPISCDAIRALARADPATPASAPRVIVATEPVAYGLSRMFEMHR